MQNILVIKLGALGDFIQAAGPFEAIRRFHPDAEITLLTTTIFAGLAQSSPWFNKIKIDPKPKITQIGEWIKLRNWLREGKFSRIYDLQTSYRSSFYFKLLKPATSSHPNPNWSGIATGCSHPHANPERDFMHTIERQKEQLLAAGISDVRPGDFSWIDGDISRFGLNENFALLVPGGAPHRIAKRWPGQSYLKLIQYLVSKNIQPVLVGGQDEQKQLIDLAAIKPACVSLAGKTTHEDLFALAQKAQFAIGNDTGPMHAFSANGCKTVVLYASDSNPKLCGQRGSDVTLIQEDTISDIKPDQIIKLLALHEINNQT
jgi:ADP-heptose:LPS heptosyltransferase